MASDQRGAHQPTCCPGVEEDVEAPVVVFPGPADAKRCHHSDVHEVLSHDAVCFWRDSNGDRVARRVGDAAQPGALPLPGGEDRDVGAFAVFRAGTWMEKQVPSGLVHAWREVTVMPQPQEQCIRR